MSGKHHGQYGSWEINVKGATKTTVGSKYALLVGGGIMVTAAGNIDIASTAGGVTVSSPSCITLKAPETEQVTGDWCQTAGRSILLYTSASTAGIHKFDGAVIANAVTGLSTAQTGVSFAVTGTKIEASGFEAVKSGAKLSNSDMKIANGAIQVLSLGMLKLG